jgi:hypothetical protein
MSKKLLTIISLILVFVFAFFYYIFNGVYVPTWQNEHNKCLQGDDDIAATCINEKRQRWWQFDFLYKNRFIGTHKN